MLPLHRQQLAHSETREDCSLEEKLPIRWRRLKKRPDLFRTQMLHLALPDSGTFHDSSRIFDDVAPTPSPLEYRVQLPDQPVEGGVVHLISQATHDEVLHYFRRDA